MNPSNSFIEQMPKVELHVHLEGATTPATLLHLAHKNRIALPADTVEGLQEWYQFRDFRHFVEIYLTSSQCIQSPEDIEFIAREFLKEQARQHIVYSEVTYTAYTHWKQKGIPFDEQLDAINRARAWAQANLGVDMQLIIDMLREEPKRDNNMLVAEWAVSGMGKGVVALGLAGEESAGPTERYIEMVRYAHENGLSAIIHAGEIVGAHNIWDAIEMLGTARIGHGVTAIHDAELLAYLAQTQIPLEVCPTSNVALGVARSFEEHPLPRLKQHGLNVTVNSDDPPMFNTTLTREYQKCMAHFGFDLATLEQLVLNAVRATLLPKMERSQMEVAFRARFDSLHTQLGC